jgi:hypothetical protein
MATLVLMAPPVVAASRRAAPAALNTPPRPTSPVLGDRDALVAVLAARWNPLALRVPEDVRVVDAKGPALNRPPSPPASFSSTSADRLVSVRADVRDAAAVAGGRRIVQIPLSVTEAEAP